VKPSAGNGAAAFTDIFSLQPVEVVDATTTFGLTVQFLSKDAIEIVPFEAVPMSALNEVREPGATDEVLAHTPDSTTVVGEKNCPVGSTTEKRRNFRKSRTVVL